MPCCGQGGIPRPPRPEPKIPPGDLVRMRYTGRRGGLNFYQTPAGAYLFGTARREWEVKRAGVEQLLQYLEGGEYVFEIATAVMPAPPATPVIQIPAIISPTPIMVLGLPADEPAPVVPIDEPAPVPAEDSAATEAIPELPTDEQPINDDPDIEPVDAPPADDADIQPAARSSRTKSARSRRSRR